MLIPLLLVVAAGAFLFRNALFGGETFFERDLVGYYRPARSLLVPLARSSDGWPLWNPFYSSGQPFAANPTHQLFHPLTALFFVLPFEWAFRLQVILPVFMAAGGMLFLLRALRRSRGAALFGALVWGFGGYILSATNLLLIHVAVSALPACLGFGVLALRRGERRFVVGLAVTFGLVCLAGEPTTILCTPFLLAATLAESAGGRGERIGTRAVSRVAIGLLLGTMLGAVALLPGVDLLRKSVRRDPLPSRVADSWSLSSDRLVQLVLPPASVATGAAAVDLEKQNQPFLFSVYPGFLTALLAGVALLRKPSRVLPWAAVALFGAVVALGSHLPVWGLLRRLPLVSGLRYPEKFLLLSLFAIAVAATTGWDEAVARRRGTKALSGALLVSLAALLLVLILRGAGDRTGGRLAPGVLLRQGVLLVGAALLVTIPRGERRRSATLVLAGVVTLDLVDAGRWLVPTRPIDLLRSPPPVVVDLLDPPPAGPVFHRAAGMLPGRLGSPFLATPPFPVFWGIPLTLEADFDLTQLAWSRRAAQAFREAVRRRPDLMAALLARRGVGAVVEFRPGVRWSSGRPEWPPGMTSPLEVVRPRDPPEFAFLASAVERIRGESDWVEAVVRLGPAAARTACLEESEADGVPRNPSAGELRLLQTSPGRVVFDVESRGPEASFVAVNQTWDEGWSALVDGSPVRLRRADLALSGLTVPPGRHRVEIVYDAPWVRRGIATSLLALVICLGLVLLPRAKRGANGSPD